jgi:hypothetical protein
MINIVRKMRMRVIISEHLFALPINMSRRFQFIVLAGFYKKFRKN